jgi:cytochrome c-type biogenesis protein CcmF
VLDKASKVSTEFYVDTNLPLAILILLLLSFVPLLAWGKNNASHLPRKLIWGLMGAVVAGAITLSSGYPGATMLVLAVLAGAAVGLNLQLAIRLMTKKITLSAGAVAHLGVGLMFLGIIASSAYDRSEKVRIVQGNSQSALGYQLQFIGPEFFREPRGIRLELPLIIKKGDGQYTAIPDIRSETMQGGQARHFVRPHINRGIVSDLYISPLEYSPGGREDGTGTPTQSLKLRKQEKVRYRDYEIQFVGFDISGMMAQEEGQATSVGAELAVSYKDGEIVTLKPVFTMSQKGVSTKPVKLPGPHQAYIILTEIQATTGTIVLEYEGPASSGGEGGETNPPAVIAEVSVKPGMTVLWLGTFLILLGGGIGIARRWT